MNSTTIGSIVFVCGFGGALLGAALRNVLPNHHLVGDSKEAVKVGMGLVATMAALVLGLLVASAKSSYDAQSNELTEMSAKVVVLDRILAHYGPETKKTRDLVRSATIPKTVVALPNWMLGRLVPTLSTIAFRNSPPGTTGKT